MDLVRMLRSVSCRITIGCKYYLWRAYHGTFGEGCEAYPLIIVLTLFHIQITTYYMALLIIKPRYHRL